jgi:hypothetical protein
VVWAVVALVVAQRIGGRATLGDRLADGEDQAARPSGRTRTRCATTAGTAESRRASDSAWDRVRQAGRDGRSARTPAGQALSRWPRPLPAPTLNSTTGTSVAKSDAPDDRAH